MTTRLFTISLVHCDRYCESNYTIVEHSRVQLDQFDEIINAFLKHPKWEKDETRIEVTEQDGEQ